MGNEEKIRYGDRIYSLDQARRIFSQIVLGDLIPDEEQAEVAVMSVLFQYPGEPDSCVIPRGSCDAIGEIRNMIVSLAGQVRRLRS